MNKIWILARALSKNSRSTKDLKTEEQAATSISMSDLSGYLFPIILGAVLLAGGYFAPQLPIISVLPYVDFLMVLTGLVLAVTLVFSLMKIINTMYLSDDLTQLLVLPFKEIHIFAAKILLIARNQYALAAALILPFTIGFSVSSAVSVREWIAAVFAFVFVPAMALCAVGIIVLILMRFVGFLHNQNLLKIVGSILAAILLGGICTIEIMENNSENNFLQTLATLMVANKELFATLNPIAAWLKDFVQGSTMSLVYIVGITLVLSAVFAVLIKTLYLRAALSMISASSASKPISHEKLVRASKKQSVAASIVRRDCKLILRDSALLLKEIFSPLIEAYIIVAAMAFGLKELGQTFHGQTGGPAFYIAIPLILSAMAFFNISPALSSFSRERETFFVTKQLPMSNAQLLKGKRNVSLWWCALTVFIPQLLLTVIITICDAVPVVYAIFSIPMSISVCIIHSNIQILMDAKNPNFLWQNHDEMKPGFVRIIPSIVSGVLSLLLPLGMYFLRLWIGNSIAGIFEATLIDLLAIALAIWSNRHLVKKGSKLLDQLYIS